MNILHAKSSGRLNATCRKVLRGVPVAMMVFLSGSAFAQRQLAIDDAVKIGLEQNRALKISMLKAESVGDARVSEIQSGRLPSLKFYASYTRLSDIASTAISVPIPGVPPIAFTTYFPDNWSTKLSLTQPLFTGFRLQNMQKVAERNSAAAQADVITDKRGIVFTIKQQYWSVFVLQATLDAENKQFDDATSHLADVKNKFTQGVALENDVLKTEVQVSNIELSQIQTRKDIRIAMAALMNTIGLPLDTQINLTTAPDELPPPTLALTDLIQTAQSHRSELTAIDERIAAGDASVSIAKSGYFPQVSVGADLLYQDPNQRYFPAQNVFKTTWDAGINLSWDVWNWNTSGYQAQQAQYSLEGMQQTKLQMQDAIALEVTQNFLSLQTTVDQIRVAKLAVDQATENLRVVNEQFNKGVANNTDVLDAQAALMQASVNKANAIAGASVAKARLDNSLGG